ncbi:hypothetical protein RHMOL_Rhmol06G0187000 [Rhododendron molle]|uniref:Uncharacterized protein n=1 Tax=Rhododendron molle TaxID=49168 RepID=A0ACC0NG35_RHOML|nr:hypothetical protein RHMOL_Rhmol06G0187000 [Rhododendron molle]
MVHLGKSKLGLASSLVKNRKLWGSSLYSITPVQGWCLYPITSVHGVVLVPVYPWFMGWYLCSATLC